MRYQKTPIKEDIDLDKNAVLVQENNKNMSKLWPIDMLFKFW